MLQRLKKRGYISLTELHLQLNPSLGACPVFSGNSQVQPVPTLRGDPLS
jgi:hypothetical protein